MMSVDIELRKAAALINAGRIDAARTILSDYLKDVPESDLAWLLMSYVLDDPRKQQAAATRALRFNPDNEQAKARIDQLLQFQAPTTPEITSESFSRDFERYNPDQEPLVPYQEESTTPITIKERLAFVTNGTEGVSDNYSRDYPEESFLSDKARRRRAPLEKETGKPSKKIILRAAVFVVLLGVIIFLGVKFVTGGFISEADALATASMETQIAWATNEVRGQLPPTWTPTVTPSLVPTSSPTPSPVPTGTATEIPPDPTVEAAISNLQQQVVELRQLPMLNDVETYLIHRSKVRSIVKNYYYSLEGAEEEIENNRLVLIALGLIDPNYDLETSVFNSLVDSVGGFYLHETDQIYVLGHQFAGVEKFIYSHEFAHALVDQNYDFEGMGVYPRCVGNEDQCKAVQALIEGDATKLMQQWYDERATVSERIEITAYEPPRYVLPEQEPPPFAFRNSEFPYTSGLAFVEELYSSGEWTGVNQAYARLPESTEQILHPSKYFSGEQPLPVSSVSLDAVLGEEWELIKSNTLGEWLTYLILGYGTNPQALLNESEALLASGGWGGDHYQVHYNNLTNEVVLVVHWKWDTTGDMNEFTNGMGDYLKGRFPYGEVVELNRECWYGIGQFSCLYKGIQQNLWIIAPNVELLDAIGDLYSGF
jgi:hypothetical protein